MPSTIVVAGGLVHPLPWCGHSFFAMGQRVKWDFGITVFFIIPIHLATFHLSYRWNENFPKIILCLSFKIKKRNGEPDSLNLSIDWCHFRAQLAEVGQYLPVKFRHILCGKSKTSARYILKYHAIVLWITLIIIKLQSRKINKMIILYKETLHKYSKKWLMICSFVLKYLQHNP